MSMDRDDMKRMREAVAENTGERYCAYCSNYRPTGGGKFMVNKSNRRWMCQDCRNIRKERMSR